MNNTNKMKLICFDLDGVLVDARDIHYIALNKALADIDPKYIISKEEHLSTYDGRSTTTKLLMLNKSKGLPSDTFDIIWNKKQEYTTQEIDKFEPDLRLQAILEKLVEEGYTLVVTSNSIRINIKNMLEKKGLLPYITYYFSNQDVINTKPHCEIYLRAMLACGVGPKETLILEDSHIGRTSALNSGAYLCPIIDPNDVTYEKIKSYLNFHSTNIQPKWQGGSMNIVIPMAGKGSRFAQAGYTFPKPLIPINKLNGKPMIQVAVENINTEARYIYIVQKEHYEKYHLKTLLNLITPNCEIIQVEGVTEGAACSVLLAEQFINNDSQLFIANSDQFVEWDSNQFFYSMQGDSVDAGLATFESCFAYSTKVDTLEYGKIPIGKIVNNKLNCHVLGYNEITKNFEYCKVKNFIKNDGKLSKWLKMISPWKGITYVTDDHKFLTKNGYIEAKKLIDTDKILTQFKKMNNIQKEIFEGTMLGDGSISKVKNRVNSGLKFSHSIKQKNWALAKLEAFSSLGIQHYETIVKQKYKAINCRVNITEEFKEERERWYKNGKKIIPKDIQLSKLLLATWYQDDGGLTSAKNPTARFSVNAFTTEDVLFLQDKLKELKFNSYIITEKNGQHRLVISTESSDSFFNYIQEYIIKDMRYKLPEKYRNTEYCFNQLLAKNELYYIYDEYYSSPRFELYNEQTWNNKFSYCLETDFGNFVVDNMVAHNCHPKWSFAKLDDNGFVCEVAEKNPISSIASTGFYWYRHGKDFVSCAKKMILNNKRVNNEFYVCPVLNELINERKKVKIHNVNKMWSLGTPEDLKYFEENYENK